MLLSLCIILLAVGVYLYIDLYPCYIVTFKIRNERDTKEELISRVVARGKCKKQALEKATANVEEMIEILQKAEKEAGGNPLFTHEMMYYEYIPREITYSTMDGMDTLGSKTINNIDKVCRKVED